LSSPHLHTLVLRLKLSVGRADPSPRVVDADLNAVIDALCLPALTSFEFSLNAWLPPHDHAMDFSPVLRANPLLTNLTLNVDGICVPSDADAAYLPRLRTFTGTVNNCAAVSAHARELRNVTILLPQYYADRPESPPFPFTPSLFRRNTGPAVTRLDARAVALGGRIARYPALLCPTAFDYLAAAFPNLTHLNASLGKPMVYKHHTIQIGGSDCSFCL
jgi:hypothetical protein